MASFKVKEAIHLLPHVRFEGNAEQSISGVLGIQDALQGVHADAVTWVNDKKSAQIQPQEIQVGLLILSAAGFENLKSAKANFLIVENPRAAFFQLVEKYFKTDRLPKVESTAVVDPDVIIGKDCYIGHHVVIEKNCRIGNNTTILHNTAVLEGTIIGNHVTIGCNNTIGNYGFGYEKDGNEDYFLLQHIGHVVIHDHVEIHNNTCIDRGVLGTTEIHDNVKIDNQVHVAHGVTIGRNSLIIANAMLGGSARIGENTWIAPSVSVKNQITVASNTMTGIGAVILKDTQEKSVMIGNPAITMEEHKKWSEIKKKLS